LCEGGEGSSWRDGSDAIVVKIGDVDSAIGPDRYGHGEVELGLAGWSAIPGQAESTVPSDHPESAVRFTLKDLI
jgi:hypothetical protein